MSRHSKHDFFHNPRTRFVFLESLCFAARSFRFRVPGDDIGRCVEKARVSKRPTGALVMLCSVSTKSSLSAQLRYWHRSTDVSRTRRREIVDRMTGCGKSLIERAKAHGRINPSRRKGKSLFAPWALPIIDVPRIHWTVVSANFELVEAYRKCFAVKT